MNAPSAALLHLAERAHAGGVVGASGGGFALCAKLTARPYRRLIINAAQSEPLICKDWAVLSRYAGCVLNGARLLSEAMGLSKAFLAVREEFQPLLPELPAAARKHGVTLVSLPDIYPAGYEKILKRELFGIPMSAVANDDVLVINAETLRNLSWAVSLEKPVTSKLVTIAGAVRQPTTLNVPIGTPFAECLRLAGGAACAQPAVYRNGVLSGNRVEPENSWVDATTLGYVLLPPTHSVLVTPPTNALAARRATFLESTAAGRTQTMSAAVALFDLGAFRRARPAYGPAVGLDYAAPTVRLAAGRQRVIVPCVAVGDRVVRGQRIACVSDASALPLHASVEGIVEHADAQAILVRRNETSGAMHDA